MAFYEMLPGAGMPPGLQAGMDSVLNKKFGTSTTYPAEDWPDTVNLMGPLPEKTASGSIAHITDGADAVPIKSWEVEIAPTLTGKSAIECTQTGKNLVDVSTATGTGTIWFHYDNGIELKKGATYTFSCGNYGTGSIALYGIDHSTQVAYAYISASSAQVTYTPTENITVCPRIYQSGLTISNLANVQLEVGSTATTYEPYVAPTIYTAVLGRTIHGGTVDVVNGQGESTFAKGSKALSDFAVGATVGDYTAYTYSGYISESINNNNKQIAYIGTTQIPYIYQGIEANTTHFYIGTNGQINLYLPNDWSDFTNDIEAVAELATPETFTFTPITPTPETALGVNNFWAADKGDSSVTYRADIDLLLGGI